MSILALLFDLVCLELLYSFNVLFVILSVVCVCVSYASYLVLLVWLVSCIPSVLVSVCRHLS